MSDVREEIIARLLEVAQTVPGIVYTARNVHSVDDDKDVELPAAVILDGDENAVTDEPSRRPIIARRFEMTPLILIVTGAKPEDIGTDLNTLRSAFIKKVINDTTLLGFVDRHGIRYDGMDTPRHENGRMMLGQKVLRFTFTYLLDPNDL